MQQFRNSVCICQDSEGDASWVEKPSVAPSGGTKAERPGASGSDVVKGPVLEVSICMLSHVLS